jgi:hypothetical protein
VYRYKTPDDFCFYGKPLKYSKRSDRDTGTSFSMEIPILDRKTLRVFLHPPPPLERESLIRIVELTIPKATTLSI